MCKKEHKQNRRKLALHAQYLRIHLHHESSCIQIYLERDVERPLIVRWVVGSIIRGESIELFLIPASAPGGGMCYPVCGMVHIKEPLLLIGKSSSCFSYLNGTLPYVRHHITVNYFLIC